MLAPSQKRARTIQARLSRVAKEGESSLLRLAVGPQTRLVYDLALSRFLKFSQARHRADLDIMNQHHLTDLDAAALLYCEVCVTEGQGNPMP